MVARSATLKHSYARRVRGKEAWENFARRNSCQTAAVIETSTRDRGDASRRARDRLFQGHVRVGRTGTGMIHVEAEPWDPRNTTRLASPHDARSYVHDLVCVYIGATCSSIDTLRVPETLLKRWSHDLIKQRRGLPSSIVSCGPRSYIMQRYMINFFLCDQYADIIKKQTVKLRISCLLNDYFLLNNFFLLLILFKN